MCVSTSVHNSTTMISLGLTFGQQIAADGREFGVELVQQVVHYGGEFG